MWVDVTSEELKAFLGVIMNMVLNLKAQLLDYFSEERLNRTSFFKDDFSHQQFLQLFCVLHLVPPLATPGVHPQGSIIKNGEYMDRTCKQYYAPGEYVSIDDSTVGVQRESATEVLQSKEAGKCSLLIYCICDSTNDNIFYCAPCYGRTTVDSLVHPDLLLAFRIVIHLVHILQSLTGGMGFHVFTARFYTIPQLAVELHKMKIHTTGTVTMS
jgi:hypothetical protein